MADLFHTIGGKIVAAISGILLLFSGGAHTATNTQPSVQTASAIVATQEVSQTSSGATSTPTPSGVAATTTVVNNYISYPVIERIVERTVQTAAPTGYVTQEAFTTAINELSDRFGRIISGSTYPAPASNFGSGGIWNAIAASNKIDHLSGTDLSDITVDGVSGLTDADIPDGITASNYLPLSGGSLTFASSTLLSVLNSAYFGATATSSFDSAGALTLATPLALTSGGTGWSNFNAGSILFGNGSLAIATSSSFFWDNTNGRLGVGTTSPLGRLSVTGAGSGSGTTFLVANNSNTPTFSVFDDGTVSFAPSVNGTSGGNTAVQNLVAAQPSGTVTGTYTGFRTSMGYNSSSDTSGAVTGIYGVGRLYNGVANQTQGIYGVAEFDGTGVKSGSLYGGRFQSQVTSTGSITHVIGIKLDGPSIASGATISQTFGLYVQDINAGNLGTVTGNSAAIQIEGAGVNNAIGFSGAGGSGVNSKIYSSAANQLNIEASSNLFLNSLGGNVGIGTSSPGTKLDVRGTAGALSDTSSGIAFVGTGMSKLQIGYDSTVGNGYAWLQASKNSSTWSNLILNPNGNGRVGIGTTSPETVFDVRGSSAALSNSASGIAFVGTGMSKLQIGYDTSTTNGYAWLAATKSSATWSDVVLNPAGTGKVGIASTTPWRTLSVTGTVGIDGLTGSTGAGSLCLSANKEVVYNSGSDSCLSSTRATKHDILPLDLAALDMVNSLQPVSFIYNNDASSTVRYGFIAEDAAAVDAHLATYDAQGAISGIDDRSIISIIVAALQELIEKVGSFADKITTRLLAADQVDTKKLCVEKSDGSNVCVTGDQLAAALAGNSSSGSSAVADVSNDSAQDTEPPTITINGNNPAEVEVGTTYSDLGASVTDNVDQNLGIKTFVGETLIEFAVIDTSAPTTYHIYYVATDNAGNTATSTRTVIVKTPTAAPETEPAPSDTVETTEVTEQ